MGFMKLLIGLPILIVILIFAFVNNDLATFDLWPFYFEITVSLSVAVVFFILLGFILGLVWMWMSYAPVRKALRQQVKQNKKLSKEQQKLVEKVSGLQSNLASFKAAEAAKPKPTIKERFKAAFSRKPKTGEAAETK